MGASKKGRLERMPVAGAAGSTSAFASTCPIDLVAASAKKFGEI
jgi:hypothetical protein